MKVGEEEEIGFLFFFFFFFSVIYIYIWKKFKDWKRMLVWNVSAFLMKVEIEGEVSDRILLGNFSEVASRKVQA